MCMQLRKPASCSGLNALLDSVQPEGEHSQSGENSCRVPTYYTGSYIWTRCVEHRGHASAKRTLKGIKNYDTQWVHEKYMEKDDTAEGSKVYTAWRIWIWQIEEQIEENNESLRVPAYTWIYKQILIKVDGKAFNSL